MDKSDSAYLAKQYRTPVNLNARITLHQRFSTNPHGWHPWLFDQFDLPPRCRILELGCGPGDLWALNLPRIPAGWQITLTDFSMGMLEQARQRLSGQANFEFRQVDANQPLPFETAEMDVVVANHMLYHIAGRAALLNEIRRVLKPEGRLYASTVGEQHLKEIGQLLTRFDPALDGWITVGNPFTMENGAAQLSAAFPQIEIRRYPDALAVTDPDLLVDYMLSGWADRVGPDRVPALRAMVVDEMAKQGGVFHVTKDSGLFIAYAG